MSASKGSGGLIASFLAFLLLTVSSASAKPTRPWDLASQKDRNAYIVELALKEEGLEFPSTTKEWVKRIIGIASTYGLPQSRAIVLPETLSNGYAWKDAQYIYAVKKQIKAAIPGQIMQMVWKDAKTRKSSVTTVIVSSVSSRTVTFLENLPDPKRKNRDVIQKRSFAWTEVERSVGSKFTIYEVQGGPAPKSVPKDDRIVLQWPLSTAKPAKPSTPFGADWGKGRKYCKDLPMTHTGVDIPDTLGNPVYAAEDGDVQWVTDGTGSGFAYGITIQHTHPVIGLYTTVSWHIDPVSWIQRGVHVTKGDQIGTIASIDGTDHLHFGVRIGKYNSVYSDKGALPTNDGCPELVKFKEKFVDPWKQDQVVFQ
jgi:murein DD-endopeptidase MepM/ murein hydrolase activator NlpD